LTIDPNHLVILLNKAAILMKEERYHDAYQAAKLAVNNPDCNMEKCLYRMAKSAYGMRDWKLSLEHYKKLQILFLDLPVAEEGIKVCNERIIEQETGRFDFNLLFRMSRQLNVRNFDIADCTHPSVEIQKIEGRGLGLVVKEDIPTNTVLVVSKAFANDLHYADRFEICNVGLTISETVHSVVKQPHRAKEFFSLWSGIGRDYLDDISDGVIDVARVESICKLNTFQIQYERKNPFKLDAPGGVWIVPSYLNHSCVPNCTRFFYGDILVVNSTAPIKKGEEVLVSYVYSSFPLEKRTMILETHYGFKCTCSLCEKQRKAAH
jgi:hypothetical protein